MTPPTAAQALAARVAQDVSEAVSEAIGAQMQPVLSRHISKVPELSWQLLTDEDPAWMVDGLGPVRVSAQIPGRDYGEIRAFIDEIARTFDGERIREASPFPGRPEITNVEVTVSIEGIPVTVWGTTDS